MREGHAIVGAQSQRQPVFAKGRFKQRSGVLTTEPVRHRLAPQQQATVRIGDGQRLAARPVRGPKPALEVRTPRVVGLAH